MQPLISCIVCAFLVLDVLGAHGVLSCQSDKQCGVLENIIQKQACLEKKVAAHSKILAGKSCTEGIVVANLNKIRIEGLMHFHLSKRFAVILNLNLGSKT